MSIFYDVACQKFTSMLVGCDWIGSIGAIIEFIMNSGL